MNKVSTFFAAEKTNKEYVATEKEKGKEKVRQAGKRRAVKLKEASQVAEDAVDVTVATEKRRTLHWVEKRAKEHKKSGRKTKVGQATERDATNRINEDAVVEGGVVRTTSGSKVRTCMHVIVVLLM
jgi:hypothetical protein